MFFVTIRRASGEKTVILSDNAKIEVQRRWETGSQIVDEVPVARRDVPYMVALTRDSDAVRNLIERAFLAGRESAQNAVTSKSVREMEEVSA